MTTYTTLNDWVNSNIKGITDKTSISTDAIHSLIALGDAEDPNYISAMNMAVTEYTDYKLLDYIASLRPQGYDSRNSTDITKVGAGLVYVKKDPYSNDGIIIACLVDPFRSLFYLQLRVAPDFSVKNIMTIFCTYVTTNFVKPSMIQTGDCGDSLTNLFVQKDKYDSRTKLDPELTPVDLAPIELTPNEDGKYRPFQ